MPGPTRSSGDEGLLSSRRFEAAVDVPILANMTEFGKSELFTNDQSPVWASTR
jgi:hypothetical protein